MNTSKKIKGGQDPLEELNNAINQLSYQESIAAKWRIANDRVVLEIYMNRKFDQFEKLAKHLVKQSNLIVERVNDVRVCLAKINNN
jgi:hypothetical protein